MAASDEAVKKATGHTWDEWLKILDKEGAKKKSHQEIVAIVAGKHGVGPWWQQMVTVTYEQRRGLREVHQTAAGYVANVSKTINAPLAELYEAWSDARRRAKWLRTKLTVRKATEKKSMRITWPDDTSVEVGFYAKGRGKSMVAVQQSKLKDKNAVTKAKTFWREALEKLQESLEA